MYARPARIPKLDTAREQLGILAEALQVHQDHMRELDKYAIGGSLFPRYLELLDSLINDTNLRFNNLTQGKSPGLTNLLTAENSAEQDTSANPDGVEQVTSAISVFSIPSPIPPSSISSPSTHSYIPSPSTSLSTFDDNFSVPTIPLTPRTIIPRPPKQGTTPVLALPCHFLFETATGFALFELLEDMESEEEIEYFAQSFPLLREVLRLAAFEPFASQAEAGASLSAIRDGVMPDSLERFFGKHFPKSGTLEFTDLKLAWSELPLFPGVSCDSSRSARPMFRGIREFFAHFIAARAATRCAVENARGANACAADGSTTVNAGGGCAESVTPTSARDVAEHLTRAQRGLAHQAGAAKISFASASANFNVVQAIAMRDEADTNIDVISRHLRDWYSTHFPELAKLVSDDVAFAKMVKLIGDKRHDISQVPKEKMADIIGEETTETIYKSARASIGNEVLEVDLNAFLKLADEILYLSEYREVLRHYIHDITKKIAPNLHTLMGELGARIIAHAGGLLSLAKMPACTIQIMGAEKALFRARRTRGNTPKYGLIFRSPFVQMASAKDRGKVARTLAGKIAIAARIDLFRDEKTDTFGQKLGEQMAEKLEFINNPEGPKPKRNIQAMKEASEESEREVEEGRKRRKEGRKGEEDLEKKEEDGAKDKEGKEGRSPSSIFSELNL